MSVIDANRQGLQIRVQGDPAVLKRFRTRSPRARVIHVKLPGKTVRSSRVFERGPVRGVEIRPLGRGSVVAFYTRQGARTLLRRLRLVADGDTLTVALFANQGALARWIAKHPDEEILVPGIVARKQRKKPEPKVTKPVLVVEQPAVAEVPLKEQLAALAAGQGPSPKAPAPQASARTATPAPAKKKANSTAPISKPPLKAQPEAGKKPAPRKPPATASSARPSRWAVAGLLLALVAAALILRKRSAKLLGNSELAIRVLGSRGLGGKHRLSVVEVGSHRFLVSLDQGGTRLISRLKGERQKERDTKATSVTLAAAAPPPPVVAAPAVAKPVVQKPIVAKPAGAESVVEPPPQEQVTHKASPRLRLVTPRAVTPPRADPARTRVWKPSGEAVGPVAQAPQPPRRAVVPLGRLAAPAVTWCGQVPPPPGAVPHPAPAAPRPAPRKAVQPAPRIDTTATDPTIHVPLTQVVDESDVAGLIRLKATGRRVA